MSPARTISQEGAAIPTWTPMSPPQRPTIGPARTASAAGGSRNDKRLSLNLPLQPSGVYTFARHTPSSSVSATPTTTTGSVTSFDTQVSPGGTGSFLTALAAQERRVLELREDLQRAEADLAQLKSQWALHEMTRKRYEVQHVEQLQTFGVLRGDTDGCVEGKSELAGSDIELDRRKAMGGDTSPAKRKVFSGSRHMRTLSLLSSNARNNYRQPLTSGGNSSQSDNDGDPAGSLSRSSTMPILLPQPRDIATNKGSNNRPSTRDPPREALLRTGKQIAVDFKESLWTFIEDLRQATVGDEGVNATQSRTMSASPAKAHRQPSKMGLRNKETQSPVRQPLKADITEAPSRNAVDDSALIDVGSRLKTASETDDKARPKAVVSTLGRLQQPAQGDGGFDDESWESWDSPSSKTQPSDWTGNTWLSDIGFSSPLHEGIRSTWYVGARFRYIPLVAVIFRLFLSPRQYLSSR